MIFADSLPSCCPTTGISIVTSTNPDSSVGSINVRVAVWAGLANANENPSSTRDFSLRAMTPSNLSTMEQSNKTEPQKRIRQGKNCDPRSKSIILRPGMNRPLRLARVYGFLIQGRDGLYHP